MQIEFCLPILKLAASQGEKKQQLGDCIIMDSISSTSEWAWCYYMKWKQLEMCQKCTLQH